MEKEFNTLDAQRESAEAFIQSQKAEGWVCLEDRYDDGGYSGGTIERPALKRLLCDVQAGRLDCIVVYKVDRFSRSLMDFARLMETLEKHHVSFVSVTQHFNTTHSMGRLTLNILLSFAQFEREIIAERTHDKIVAETRATPRARITCEEEERVTKGYVIDTYFALDDLSRLAPTGLIKTGNEVLLRLRYLPTARLVWVNRKWRIARDDKNGFAIDTRTGAFVSDRFRAELEDKGESTDHIRDVMFYTTNISDALYVEPVPALGLDEDGVLTLQYALKRAIERVFQVEPAELGVTPIGDPAHPNILFYEAAEGSLGILSQIAEQTGPWRRIVETAAKVCQFDTDPSASPASYDNLLDYYNQRHHPRLDRWFIKGALERLAACSFESVNCPPYADYEDHYATFFDQVLDFARRLVSVQPGSEREQRVHYWTALGLLRGIMSSPAAGVEMLRNRLDSAGSSDADTIGEQENPVHDAPDGFLLDITPGQTVEQVSWSDPQKRQLSDFARQLGSLSGPKHDGKLEAAAKTLADWLRDGFQPVVFCRYLATARYVGEQLRPLLAAKFKDLRVEVVTSEDPDDVRRQRVTDLGKSPRRLLVATDCLSEGINLQDSFTAVLHYDLPWNPNRLEQREGRVDRFGQTAEKVKAFLLFGRDNPVDGLVLGVILEKVRQIRRDRGITVPFPEDSRTVLDTVAKALLFNPDRRVKARADGQLRLELDDFAEAREAEIRITHKIEEAAKREEATRSLFAQHSIKAEELETDLREADAAIGDVAAVERFVTGTLTELLGVQIDRSKTDWRLHTGNLPAVLRAHLPDETLIDVSFHSPTPKKHLYLGRNHPFVEALCQFVMARSLARERTGGAARAAVMRSREITTKTTLLLFRCRNVIGEKNGPARIVAEEMLVWGYRGSPSDSQFLSSDEAMRLLDAARPVGDLTPQSRENYLDNELRLIAQLRQQFDAVAETRSRHLVEAHERFSRFFRAGRYEVVYPVLPMDILGLYVLLPDTPKS